MTLYQIFKKVLTRLGYLSLEKSLSNVALEFCNQILCDLNLNTAESLLDKREFNPQEKEALLNGISMLLTLYQNEGEKNIIYTKIYNAKRAALLSKTSQVEDVLPVSESSGA